MGRKPFLSRCSLCGRRLFEDEGRECENTQACLVRWELRTERRVNRVAVMALKEIEDGISGAFITNGGTIAQEALAEIRRIRRRPK